MGIRKPGLSVTEARRLAEVRSAASSRGGDATSFNPSTLKQPLASEVPSPTSKTPKSLPASDSPPFDQPLLVNKSSDSVATKPGHKSHPLARKSPRPAPAKQAVPITIPRKVTTSKVQVFVSALVPAAGVSQVFEILLQQYPPNKALQMILRRALDDYEELLADGSFLYQPETYNTEETVASGALVQTSHMMPKALLNLARAHFDPLGLESARAFGFKLATAALAVFFARETGRGR